MNGAQDFAGGVAQTLRYSSDDPRMLGVAVAVVVALVALVVLIVLLVQSLVSARETVRRSGLPARSVRFRSLTAIISVAAALLVFYALSAVYLAKSNVCTGCHVQQKPRLTTEAHRKAACVDCHRRPGAVGWARWNLDYVRWFTASGTDRSTRRPSASEASASEACLRCHGAIARGTVVVSGVRVRHSDMLYVPCVTCHAEVGHTRGAETRTESVMAMCVDCHESRQASVACDGCHEGDVALAGGLRTAGVAPTKISTSMGTNCRGCHDIRSCTRCHGLEMPHPPKWVPTHAKTGFTSKEVCWRCHPGPRTRGGVTYAYAMCNECHRFPGPHGPSEAWSRNHGAAALKRVRPARSVTRCSLCHRNPDFCDLCHKGLREKVDYANG